MALDANNQSKGFAFVEFEEEVGAFCRNPYFQSTLTCRPCAGRRHKSSWGKQLRVQEAQDRSDDIRHSCAISETVRSSPQLRLTRADP